MILADKIRINICSKPIVVGKTEVLVSVSAGDAQFNHNDVSIENTFKNADEALYKAKSSGRNRVEKYNVLRST
ncbi:MAG: diguanylate cyclase (GGDEF)-like protein [Alphaproteobacteria bacterium]